MCLEGGRTDDDGVIVVVRGYVIELDARMVFIYAPEQAGQPRQTATDDGRASRRKGQTVLVYTIGHLLIDWWREIAQEILKGGSFYLPKSMDLCIELGFPKMIKR